MKIRTLSVTTRPTAGAVRVVTVRREGLAARQMAKSNYQAALDILPRLQGQTVLSEYDRKLLEELQATMRRYERQ
jgi:hypothetical protein